MAGGQEASIDRISRALPAPTDDGFSMEDLARAGARLGLPLEGIRLGKRDVPLQKPVIAFLKMPLGGHFVVLRPVGATGTRVQVINPPSPPQIVDYDQLLKSPAWTGMVLVPGSWWSVPRVATLAALIGSALVVLALLARFRPAPRQSPFRLPSPAAESSP
jgi:hypothetical protein